MQGESIAACAQYFQSRDRIHMLCLHQYGVITFTACLIYGHVYSGLMRSAMIIDISIVLTSYGRHWLVFVSGLVVYWHFKNFWLGSYWCI